MAFTLEEAARMHSQALPHLSLLDALLPPPPKNVAATDLWSYATHTSGVVVSRRHDWRIDGERFIASGTNYESDPDTQAKAELDALLSKWEAEGKDALVEALGGTDGIPWESFVIERDVPFSLDVPLEEMTFSVPWWDAPMRVSWRAIGDAPEVTDGLP